MPTRRLPPRIFLRWGGVVDLHPLALTQNARTSGGGIVTDIPRRRLPSTKETWSATASRSGIGLARQSVRHQADGIDDIEDRRYVGTDVAACAASERAVQLPEERNRLDERGDALMKSTEGRPARVLALGCHPDDIEFMMAGTFLLLGERGAELHYCNVANGCYGSNEHTREALVDIRAREGKNAAAYAIPYSI